jgi:DNA invertase Pin-like site-specific DNA recombinase
MGRNLQDLVAFLSELHALGIDLFLHQQGFDTTTSAGKAMFQMMGVFAEFKRSSFRRASGRAWRGPGAKGSSLDGRRSILRWESASRTPCVSRKGPAWE